jgi:large subunit ribosomal protein L32
MPNPKRKISKQRRNKRRTHDKAATATLRRDPSTGVVSEYHRIDMENGMYRGKKVFEVKE